MITGGHALPNRYVIHCLGPVYGHDQPADGLLASRYRNALRLAELAGIASIVFPAISTGAFGYPIEPATRIAMQTVIDEARRLGDDPTVMRVTAPSSPHRDSQHFHLRSRHR